MPDTKLRPDAKTPAHNPSNANFEKIIADNYGDPHAEKLRQQAMAEASAAEAAEQIAKEASTAQPNTLEGSGSVPTQSSIPTSFNKSGKGKAKTPGKSSTKKWIIGGILSVLGLGGGFSVYSAISGMFNIPHFGFGGSNYSKHQSSFLAKRQEKLQARIYDPKYGIKAGEIAAMQEEGILPKDPIKFAAAVGTGPNGDPYVRHLIGPDGQLIDKAGFAKALADPKMAGWADSVTGGFSRLASWRARGPTTLRLLIGKWKIPLDYFFGSKDVSDTKTLKQKLYEKLFGEKAKPLLGDVGNNANSEADAARAKAVADGTVPELPVDNPIDGLSPTQIAVRLNASKLMGILGAALGSGCYVASEFRKAEFGIWLLKHQEMIAYAEAFFNVLNAAQAGGGNAAQLGLLLGLLFIPGKNGKSFVQSNYVQHFIFGGGINADKDLAKVALTEPGSGSKTWGTVRTFLKPFNSKLACSNVSQGVVFGATIIATFFTGGVAAILKMMALSLPMVLAMSMLDSVIQPYLVRALLGAVPGLTDGGKLAGEAMFVGATALTEQTGWTNGLHPLSKLLAYESELAVAPEMNRMTAAEHLKTSPFSIDSPDSISNRLAWSVLPYAAAPLSNNTFQNLASMVLSPFSLVASSASSILMQKTHAADIIAPDACNHENYAEMGLASTECTALVLGLTPTELAMDPDAAKTYLQNNQELDPTTGKAIAGSNLQKYQTTCMGDAVYLVPGLAGADINDASTDNSICGPQVTTELENIHVQNADCPLGENKDKEYDGTLGTTMESKCL